MLLAPNIVELLNELVPSLVSTHLQRGTNGARFVAAGPDRDSISSFRVSSEKFGVCVNSPAMLEHLMRILKASVQTAEVMSVEASGVVTSAGDSRPACCVVHAPTGYVALDKAPAGAQVRLSAVGKVAGEEPKSAMVSETVEAAWLNRGKVAVCARVTSEFQPTMESVNALTAAHGIAIASLETAQMVAAVPPPARPAAAAAAGRPVFHIGAALRAPSTAAALSASVMNASNLGWRLALVSKGFVAPSVLADYAPEAAAAAAAPDATNASILTAVAVECGPPQPVSVGSRLINTKLWARSRIYHMMDPREGYSLVIKAPAGVNEKALAALATVWGRRLRGLDILVVTAAPLTLMPTTVTVVLDRTGDTLQQLGKADAVLVRPDKVVADTMTFAEIESKVAHRFPVSAAEPPARQLNALETFIGLPVAGLESGLPFIKDEVVKTAAEEEAEEEKAQRGSARPKDTSSSSKPAKGAAKAAAKPAPAAKGKEAPAAAPAAKGKGKK